MSQKIGTVAAASSPPMPEVGRQSLDFAGSARELEAVIAATAAATLEILAATAAIETAVGSPCPSKGEEIQTAVTRIYEACCFQDLTGQRIRRIIERLDLLDQHGNPSACRHALEATDGCSRGGAGGPMQGGEGSTRLENGPQPLGVAMDQADIDAMLFGST